MQCTDINFDNFPSSISEFFTPEEFAEISEYEKQLLRNLRQHYEALRRLGLPVTPPEFMLRNRSEEERRKLVTPAVIESSDGSDSEWTPALEKPKRPSDCEECRQQYDGDCPVHGPLLCIDDTEVYYGDSYAKDLGIQKPRFGKKLQRTNDLRKSDVNADNCGVISCAHWSLSVRQPWFLQRHMKYRHHNKCLELNYDKLHPDLSLGGNSLTKVHIDHEQHDVNVILNDTDIKPTTTTQSESIKTCVNKANVDEANIAYNFSSQHDYTVKNNEKHCISKTCTNLARSDQSDIECITVKPSTNEDIGEKYNNYDVNSEGFQKTCLQKDGATLTGEKTNNTDNIFTVDVTKICGVQTHKRIHTGEKQHKCDVCNVGFTQSCDLKKHKRIHTGEKPYKCDVCNFGFTQISNLHTHKRIHTGEKLYKCDVCKVGFTTRDNLHTHKRIHTGEKPYKCDVCNVDFTTSGDLKTHKRIHAGKKPYKCDVCNVGFTQSCDLKKHKRLHRGEKPYKCDVCNFAFTQISNLHTHKRIHTGEKLYKCGVCNVGFTTCDNLKTHKRMHTGEKPYKCGVCNVGFTTCDNLKTHKRMHTGEKPYKCGVCNVGFTTYGNLKTHKRIHTGEKPYKCGVCNVDFTTSSNLKTHKRIHTGQKPQKSDVKFTYHIQLKQHSQQHTEY